MHAATASSATLGVGGQCALAHSRGVVATARSCRARCAARSREGGVGGGSDKRIVLVLYSPCAPRRRRRRRRASSRRSRAFSLGTSYPRIAVAVIAVDSTVPFLLLRSYRSRIGTDEEEEARKREKEGACARVPSATRRARFSRVCNAAPRGCSARTSPHGSLTNGAHKIIIPPCYCHHCRRRRG